MGALGAFAWSAFMKGVEASIDKGLDEKPITFAAPLTVESNTAMTWTKYKTVEGDPLPACFSLTQEAGETLPQFRARWKLGWAAFCEEIENPE